MSKTKKVDNFSKKNCEKRKSRRKANRTLAIVLAIIIVFSMAVPIVSFASTGSVDDELELLQDGEYALPDEQKTSVNYTSSSKELADKELQEYIYEQLLGCSESFNIYSFKVHISVFRDIYCNVINDNPDLFYVSSSVNYSYYRSSGNIATVYPEYSLDEQEITESKQIFENGAQKALAQLDDSMNDLQKALVLHDYICDLATYPSDAVKNDKSLYHSAYGFFYDYNTVCAGYALTYSYLLNRVGIPCEYVASTGMKHAWNSVNIDGNWYNVDLTYDDISFYNNSMNVRGGVIHKCFMKSNEALGSELGFYHFGGSTLDGCDMTDTRYDNYFWNDVNTNICVIDGDYYYLDIDKEKRTDLLIKRTQDGDESIVGKTRFSYAAVTATGTYKDENGVSQTVKIYDPLCRLVYLDNRFYISHGKNLIAYAPMNDKYVANIVYTDGSYNIMGIGVDEKGNIICQRRGDYLAFTLDKKEYFKEHVTTNNLSEYNNYVDMNLDGVINAKDYVFIKQ